MYAIGNDHTGVALKETIKKFLEDRGIEVRDFGTQSTEASNYPEIAETVANAVASVCYALLDSGVPFRFAWTLSDNAAFAAPVAEAELNTRILEAVRHPTESRQMPDALFDGSRVLHFSIHQPMETTDSFTCLSCDDGGLSPQRPLRELIV